MKPVALVAMMCAVLAGCSPAGRDDAERHDTATLRVGNGGEPKSLDPQLVTGLIEERVLSALFEGLVNLDFETMQPTPGVAESWEISPDGTEYVFHLREDAAWSNGDPLTADDFVYSWRRMLSPDLAAEYAYLLYPIENAEAFNTGELDDFAHVGVHAVDDRTLRVRLRAPTPYFLTLQIHFSFYPVPKNAIEAHGDTLERDTPWTRAGNHVSNGPFRLATWRPNTEIVVERNPHYWDNERVHLDRIVFRPVQDPSTEERLFRADELDLTTSLPLTKVDAYQRENPDALRIDPYIATEFIRFNVTREPFDDPRVRLAFAHAIDREALVDHVLKSGQSPAVHFVPPNTGGYTYGHHTPDDPGAGDFVRHTFDPARARAFLAEAGYPGGDGFPDVTLLFDTNDNVRRYCEALQNMWKTHLGVQIALQNQDGKSWLANMIALNYDVARSFWVADYPDASNFLEMFYAGSGNNRTGFDDPAYEDLLRQAARTQDANERNRLFQHAEARLLAAAPITPIYYQTRIFLKREKVRGLTPNNLGRIDWRNIRLTEAASP